MNLLGIEFAPLFIPLERRLQTLGLLFYVFVFTTTTTLFAYFLVFSNYYYVPLAYLIWAWFDRKTCQRGGRRSNWIRELAPWRWMKDYFPIRLIKTCELDPNKQYIASYSPHGIAALGAVTSFGTEAVDFSKLYPQITPYVLTLDLQFRLPVYRDFLLGMGMCSVNRESINWILTNQGNGSLILIVVGGAKEALDAHSGSAKLTLKNRKGFVRLALQHGAALIPIFAFGENEVYKQVANPEGSLLRKVQNCVEKVVGVSPPLFFGRGIYQYTFGLLPHRRPIDVIVGKPIDVKQSENATEEEVNELHEKYLRKLKELYDEHKKNYRPYENVDMEFV